MSDHRLCIDGSSSWDHCVVLAHGAGAPMDSEFMTDVAGRLTENEVRVVRFEFPYMVDRRTTGVKRPPNPARQLLQTYREVIVQIGHAERLVIGGKSMGGRIASMVADELGVGGLVCLGYPFHPPGRPEELRTAHLESLRTNTLIVQGERDTFGTRPEVERYSLSANIRFAWMPDGDHSLKPRVKSGRTAADNLAMCVDAMVTFLGGRHR